MVKHLLVVAIASAVYLLVSYFLIGFKSDQVFLSCLFGGFYLASAATRKFILGFSIFIVYWIIYDYMKAFPNYWFSMVHIGDLYRAEKALVGIDTVVGRLTPNEFWAQHSYAVLDVLCGAFYLCWIPLPLLFAGYLFYRNRRQFLGFALTFLLVNLIGFVVYYLYAAAPPWYVKEFGFEFIANTPGNTAGLIRFDRFFGVTIFQSLYAKGSNVFAAMPSLHSAYPLIVLYTGLYCRLGRINILFGIITVGIWFAAVYTSHHYVLDVVAGITTAFVGIFLFRYLSERNKFAKAFIDRYTALIS
jgi:hypothetical protein